MVSHRRLSTSRAKGKLGGDPNRNRRNPSPDRQIVLPFLGQGLTIAPKGGTNRFGNARGVQPVKAGCRRRLALGARLPRRQRTVDTRTPHSHQPMSGHPGPTRQANHQKENL